MVARWGGEEFVVLLRGCHVADAMALAEKIRTRIADAEFDDAGPATVSIGVAELTADDDRVAEVGDALDEGQAVRTERGTVLLAGSGHTSSWNHRDGPSDGEQSGEKFGTQTPDPGVGIYADIARPARRRMVSADGQRQRGGVLRPAPAARSGLRVPDRRRRAPDRRARRRRTRRPGSGAGSGRSQVRRPARRVAQPAPRPAHDE